MGPDPTSAIKTGDRQASATGRSTPRTVELAVLSSMWSDQRGSEVLDQVECLRLVGLAAKQKLVGRLGISHSGAPTVLPVNFAYVDQRVLVRLGRGTMADNAVNALVAFEVDHVERKRNVGWSVLVRGLAVELDQEEIDSLSGMPQPIVPEPGRRIIAIRADVITGRRFALSSS